MGPWARWHCVIYNSIYNGGGQCSGDIGAEQNRKRQVGSGKWAVLWAEIKSLFNLAKPRLGSDAVVPSTNVKEIKWGGENHVKWGLALAQEWPEQAWLQVNAHSRLSLLVLESWVFVQAFSRGSGASCRAHEDTNRQEPSTEDAQGVHTWECWARWPGVIGAAERHSRAALGRRGPFSSYCISFFFSSPEYN